MKKILLAFLLSLLICCPAWGMEDFDFDSLNDIIEEKTDLSFDTLLKDLTEGKDIWEIIRDRGKGIIKESIFPEKKLLAAVIAISIISALINIAAADIKDRSVGELVGLTGQLMIIGTAALSFKNSIDLLRNAADSVTDIAAAAAPFMIMLLGASGKPAAVGGGGLMAMGAVMTASAVRSIIIPALAIGILLKILNIMSGKQLLDKLSELYIRLVKTGLRCCAYIFAALITAERISSGAVSKGIGGSVKAAVKMVPVIGDVIGGVSDITLNTVSAVSSGMGIVMAAIIIIVSLAPLAEIGLTAFMFKAAAALLEPVCDKQTTEIIDTVGEGSILVFSALFIISITFSLSCIIILCGVM